MQWDVNNEMLHGSYFADRQGADIRDWMYKAAAQTDPDVDLFVNDFDVVENGQLTQALVEEAKDLLRRGIPLDGIGVQGHFTGHVNPTLLQYRLNILSEVRIPVWLTEVDVLEKDPVKRADGLETVMRTAFSNPRVQGLILWSFWSESSWRGPYTSLVDGNEWKINAAGLRYRSLLKQWTTHVTLSPTYTDQSQAYFEAPGFYGDYDVVLELPNGLTKTQKFSLNPGNGPLEIQLQLPDLTSSKLNQETPIRQQNALDIQKPTAPTLNRNYQDSDKLLVDVEQDNEFPEADDAKETELADTFKSSTGLYIGCFDNSDLLRQLKHRYEGHPAMVPDICVEHCASKGYPFAGLILASECFCGFYFNDDDQTWNENCKLPCQGNFRRSCGGQKYIAMYSTGLSTDSV